MRTLVLTLFLFVLLTAPAPAPDISGCTVKGIRLYDKREIASARTVSSAYWVITPERGFVGLVG